VGSLPAFAIPPQRGGMAICKICRRGGLATGCHGPASAGDAVPEPAAGSRLGASPTSVPDARQAVQFGSRIENPRRPLSGDGLSRFARPAGSCPKGSRKASRGVNPGGGRLVPPGVPAALKWRGGRPAEAGSRPGCSIGHGTPMFHRGFRACCGAVVRTGTYRHVLSWSSERHPSRCGARALPVRGRLAPGGSRQRFHSAGRGCGVPWGSFGSRGSGRSPPLGGSPPAAGSCLSEAAR